MEREVDVLVIGAGPAGSMAARHAALRDASTLLIEKRAEIGTPVRCGEGVEKDWLLEAGIPPSRAFVAHEVRASRIVGPDGTALVLEGIAGGKGGYVLERDLFDRHLAKEAAKAGAELTVRTAAVDLLQEEGRVVGARCEHMGDRFDIRARVVVGADGFESQVGRWAGLTTRLRARDVVSCLQYTLAGIDVDPGLADFHLGRMAPGGYAWVFPKGPDLANVGLGVPLSNLKDRGETKAYLDRFVARTPGLAKGEVLEEVAGAVSASLPVERSVADGVVLAGDAARLTDSLTGAGIRNALLSGIFAGEVAARAAAEGDASATALLDYERRWRSRLDEELARHYLIKEGLQRLDDARISRILKALSDARLPHLTAFAVLEVLRDRCPEALAAFQGLL